MIRCFVVFCLVAHPQVCQPEIEITPVDHAITSPMECARGGLIFFSQARMAQQTPEEATPAPIWFAKTRSFMEGDGSDIVRNWVEEEKARAARLEPQIK